MPCCWLREDLDQTGAVDTSESEACNGLGSKEAKCGEVARRVDQKIVGGPVPRSGIRRAVLDLLSVIGESMTFVLTARYDEARNKDSTFLSASCCKLNSLNHASRQHDNTSIPWIKTVK